MTFIVAISLAISASTGDDAVPETSEKPVNLPRSVDLCPQFRIWGLLPRSQGSRNTCSVFVTTGVLEFAVSKHNRRSTLLSVEYLNWACKFLIDSCREELRYLSEHAGSSET